MRTHSISRYFPLLRCVAIVCVMMSTVSSVWSQTGSRTHEWKKNLERKGIIDRSLPRPYRVALPLASFGDDGPKLMFTYAPATKAPVIFIKIELD